jgi:HAD superfamily hydrolase (TIGR01509 family)
MVPRAIFLDFGGTLAAPLPDIIPVFRAAARRTGLRVSWELLRRESSRAWEEMWPEAAAYVGRLPSFADAAHELALRRAGAEGPIDETVRCLREEVIAPRWHPPYPETSEVLHALRRRGYGLHVLSNHTDELPRILQSLGWSDVLASVTYSQELGVEKPDPRLFELAVRRSGYSASEVVHVGDLWDADYRGATRAGIPAIWLNRTAAPVPGPCAEIRDLRALLDRFPGPEAAGTSERTESPGGRSVTSARASVEAARALPRSA